MFRIAIFLFFLLPFRIFGQEETPLRNETPVKTTKGPYSLTEHLVYAGNMGLSFGNVTSIGISPMIGYKVTPKFIPGVGATYNYLKFNYGPSFPSESINIYGGSIWARYYVFDNIFADGEYEVLNSEWDPYFRPGVRYNLSSCLLGGGYQEGFGGLSSYVLVLYNVTQAADSPYASPLIIRVGVGFGF
ncbi:MAG TPA: hypothetical protein VFJ43_15480 [Bacteroidia bacterium]|nr:hypothetical protein [Bacteroidia bacterium]